MTPLPPRHHRRARPGATALIAAGGHYQPDTRSFAGPLAEATLRGIRCDAAVLSATAVTVDSLWGTNALDAAIKRILAEQADTVVLLADGDQARRDAPRSSSPALSIIDVLVTDDRADAAIWTPSRRASVRA